MRGVDKITVTEDVSLITFGKIPADLNLISSIFQTFSQTGINIDMISQAATKGETTSVSFTVTSEKLVDVLELINRFREAHPSIKPLISNGNVKLQLFGPEMKHLPGVAARAFAALAGAQAEVALITTSEVDISLLVPRAHFETAHAALQKEFGLEE